jgi:FMN-dependent NADH-azoreductase
MNILQLISSPRKEASFSIKLGNEIVERLVAKNPSSNVTTRNFTENPFPHLEEKHLYAFASNPASITPEQAEAIRPSDQAIDELLRADIIVIGVPMYNFNIHCTLRAWVDHPGL